MPDADKMPSSPEWNHKTNTDYFTRKQLVGRAAGVFCYWNKKQESREGTAEPGETAVMNVAQLTRTLEDYLAESCHAVVIEDDTVMFDFETAKYSISGGEAKCVLHLWSEERNCVRRVLDSEMRKDALVLTVQKFGQTRPAKLEIYRERDRRTTSAKKVARAAFQQKLKRILQRESPGWRLERITTDMDLERSFGPVYTRALLRRGQSGFAVLGVNSQEQQASVDAALTFGVLWFDYCREQQAPKCHVQGLKLFVPRGRSAIVRERMAHLNHASAKWQLFSVEESTEFVEELDCADRGNIETRLVHCPDEAAARFRFAGSIERVWQVVPEAETVVTSAAEVSFRLHGLEFARARAGSAVGGFSFRNTEQITFGTGANETELNSETELQFAELMARLRELRSPYAQKGNPLWRMSPERWLESLVVRDVSRLDDRLDTGWVYSQVPAFAAADRGMIDVLTSTRQGRLAVIELKADEDIHLPLQGIDYWARVAWHHERGEFQRYGYFRGHELSPESPLLILVAPALRVHPTTDALLRYLNPLIKVELLGVDERWREGVRVVFRKRRRDSAT
jgi:hypothetical protein